MATQGPGPALPIGWVFGFLGSLIGMLASVQFDLPAAPSIPVALTVLLFVSGAGHSLRQRSAP